MKNLLTIQKKYVIIYTTKGKDRNPKTMNGNTKTKRTFKVENDIREYTVETCTAVFASIGETERTEALYVCTIEDSGEKTEYVVFNWNMLEDEDEFTAMREDQTAWDGWFGTIKTVELEEN